MTPEKVAIVVLTYNAASWAPRQIEGLKLAGVRPQQVLVVDSSSKDQTAELYRAFGAEVLVIPQSSFNHGGTRKMAAERLVDRELLIYLTHDAVPADPDTFTAIIRAFDDPAVGMAYGRQLPRPGADAIEAHARLFNYPDASARVTLADRARLGTKVTFASDSFAAYRTSALQAVGNFPEDAFFAEDQIIAGRMLKAGYIKAYAGDARVFHSHAYSLGEDFRRYFDIGVFHNRNRWLTEEFGRPEGEGKRFLVSELRYLARNAPLRLPGALLRTLFKYAGYRTGLLECRFSASTKRRLSASPYYWRNA